MLGFFKFKFVIFLYVYEFLNYFSFLKYYYNRLFYYLMT